MACEVADFLEQLFLERFPGVVDIFPVRSERWTEEHKAIMDALTEGVRMFLRTRRHLSFEKLVDEFMECQPCAMSDTLQVSLLYGREHGLYLDDNAELKMDVKALVCKNP